MSYIAILSIPLLIMTTIVFHNFLNVLEEEIENNLANSFRKTVEHLDFQIQQLQKISLQIQMNTVFRDVDIRNKPYSVMEIRDELKKYSVSSFADRILIYHYDENCILSTDTIYSLEDFIYIYASNSDNNFNILDFANSWETEKIIFFPENNLAPGDQKSMMYLDKIPINSSENYAIIIYVISESSLKNTLNPAIVNNDSYVFINDLSSGNTIFSFSEDNDTDKLNEIISEIKGKNNPDSNRNKTNIGKFSILTIKLEDIDMEFIQVVPSNILEHKLNRIKIIYFVATLLIIVISGFAIALFLRINYKPIKTLKDNIISSLSSEDSIKENLDEIEALEYAFFHYNKENEELGELAESYGDVFKQYLLDCFIMGQAREIDNILVTCRNSGLNFDKDYYCVIMMRVSKERYDEKIRYIIAKINPKYERMDIKFFIKSDISLKKIMVVLGNQDDSEAMCKRYITDVMDGFGNIFDENVRIGVGDYVDDIFDLHLSYQQALMVLDYNNTISNTSITNVSELSKLTEKEFEYPFELFEELETDIQYRDVIKIEDSIKELLLFIKLENISLHWAKNICINVVNTIFKQMLLFDKNSSLLRKPYFQRIYDTEISSYDDIECIMDEIIHDLTNYINVGEGSYDLELLQKIAHYIQNNYMKPEFGLKSLADSIQMSPPYLSQYFKEKTNYTISEYVIKLRMRRAKHLLIGTDLSVSDLAFEVGYYSVSSFIRKFKEQEGITPGQYKKKYFKCYK